MRVGLAPRETPLVPQHISPLPIYALSRVLEEALCSPVSQGMIIPPVSGCAGEDSAGFCAAPLRGAAAHTVRQAFLPHP